MTRATWVQSNFNGGEWSPLAYGRYDLAKNKNGLAKCQNFIPTQQGGLTRRPGTRFITTTKDQAYPVRLQPFQFSVTQPYMLEFGANYLRIYADDAPVYLLASSLPGWSNSVTYGLNAKILVSGVPMVSIQANNLNNTPHSDASPSAWWVSLTGTKVIGGSLYYLGDLATPYSATDIWALSFTQSADVLYLAHPNYPPMKVQRLSATSWSIVQVAFLDGPYLPLNVTGTTLSPAALTGTVVVSASAVTGINNNLGFQTTDVGRALRIKCNGVWLWGTIVAPYIDTLHCNWAIAAPTGGMIPAQATAVANISGGSVFSINVLNGGGGYGAQPPTVTLTGGGGSGAVAYAVLTGGVVSEIVVSVTGTGYTSAPTVAVAPPPSQAVGTAVLGTGGSSGWVVSVTVNNGGGGYVGAPSVGFIGGGGSGAAYTAVLTNGAVSSFTLGNQGTGYTTPPTVVIDPPPAMAAVTTAFWRLGLWESADGYPAVVTFHQDRACWAGAMNSPNRVDCSNTGDYENMAPTLVDDVVTDACALAISLNSGYVNAIQWLESDQWGLLFGTSGGEWVAAPSSTQQALTPTNLNCMPMSNYGSAANLPPLRVGRAVLFIQRTGRKLRELMYQFMLQTFQALDISLVWEHLTAGGIKQQALALAPQQVVWFVTNPGALAGLTYDKDQDVNGGHSHILGGFSDVAQTLPPVVESVAAIPAPGITRDELWVSVQRYVNGAVMRSIEVLSKPWEDGDTVAACNFLDCSAATPGGAPSTSVTGLTWLVGQTVAVLADGAVHPLCTVANDGSITLDWAASLVQVGLPYTSLATTLSIEAGGQDGPAQSKIRRVFKTVFRFFQTLGMFLGSDDPSVGSYPVDFREVGDSVDAAIPLYSGYKRWDYEGSWNREGQVSFSTNEPIPVNITQLVVQLDTQEAE